MGTTTYTPVVDISVLSIYVFAVQISLDEDVRRRLSRQRVHVVQKNSVSVPNDAPQLIPVRKMFLFAASHSVAWHGFSSSQEEIHTNNTLIQRTSRVKKVLMSLSESVTETYPTGFLGVMSTATDG